MAAGAILSKLALVRIILLMAGKALLGRTFEDIIDVTGLAFYLPVCPG